MSTAELSLSAEPFDGAERRLLSILFVDIVGWTPMAAQLDPEDARDLLRDFQQACRDQILLHGGFVAQYLGDGLIAYFGYPAALEDGVDCAVRAGLGMLAALASTGPAALKARVGIATGLAVVGDQIHGDISGQHAVTGHVANLASRIQNVAAPGSLFITDTTRGLIGNRFACIKVGKRRLKGVRGLVMLWRVEAEVEHILRYQVRVGASSLIGRTAELARLKTLWSASKKQVTPVMLIGDAGIGKSALAVAVRDEAAASGGTTVLQCSDRHRHTPLYPLIEQIERAADARLAEAPRRIAAFLEQEGLADDGDSEKLTALLTGDTHPALARMSPKALQTAMIELCARYLLLPASHRRHLIVVEDAHWVDPTTQEVIEVMFRQRPRHPVLLLLTARPEYNPPWLALGRCELLSLRPLRAMEARQLVLEIAGKRLETALVEAVAARSEGVPLFAVELTRAVIDGGETAKVIPDSLVDSLAARLDRLGKAKVIAQTAAVIGRRFEVAILAALMDTTESALREQLVTLIDAGLLTDVSGNGAEFVFSHQLLQDVALQTMLRRRRATIHAQLAAMLEESPSIVASEPERVAHHWIEGRQPKRAAPLLISAAQKALAKGANREAIAQLETALTHIADLPDDHERTNLELDAVTVLGQARYVADGPAHLETIRAFSRAQTLVGHAAINTERSYVILYGIFSSHHFASQFDLAERPAHIVYDLARSDGDPAHLCLAHRMLSYIAFFRGQHDEAVHHFEAAGSLCSGTDTGDHTILFGADSLVATACFHAVLDVLAGRGATALRRARAALDRAIVVDHAATVGWAYAASCYVHYFAGDRAAAGETAQAGVAYCRDHGVSTWELHCRLFAIWADPAGRIRDIRKLIDEVSQRTRLGVPLFRAVITELLLARGRRSAAAREAQTGLDEVVSSGQTIFAPHLKFLAALSSGRDFEPAIREARLRGAGLIESWCKIEMQKSSTRTKARRG